MTTRVVLLVNSLVSIVQLKFNKKYFELQTKKRGGLAGEGAVVVKVSKTNQDMRFDVPVVGLNTLKTMVEVGARVLAVEAKNSIILDRERFVEEANKADIVVVGYTG